MKGKTVSRKAQRHLRRDFLKYDPPDCQRRPAYVAPGPNTVKTGCSHGVYQMKCNLKIAFAKATGVQLPASQTNAALFVLWAIAVYSRAYTNLQEKPISALSVEGKRRRRRNRNRNGKAA